MLDFTLLEKLCMLNGVSGDEKTVRSFIFEKIKNYADDITIDNLGNLIVFKKGKNRAVNKLMISAHMDEVGFMVTDITPEGYLKFDEVGGIDRRILPGKRVLVGQNNIPGVIGIKPVHLTKGEEGKEIPDISDMYADIGAKSYDDAKKYITVGDCIYFACDFEQNNTTIKAKAIDDRFGCFVLINLIKNELEYDTYFTFVVQEEVGLRGAKVAAYTVDPDFALVIESTTAADVPEIEKNRQVCCLSNGAVVSVMDRSTIYDKELVKAAFECADEKNISIQYKRAVAGGNDSGAIHQSKKGVRTLAISLPCRYIHAPSCIADKNDCESVYALTAILSEKIAGGKI